MGQVSTSDHFPSETRKRLRKNLTNIGKTENLQKHVNVLFKNQNFTFEYTQGIAKVGNLLSEFKKKVDCSTKIVAFKSCSGIEIIDFMLCSLKFQLFHLDNYETILPIFQEDSQEEGLQNYHPIKTIGKGGFSLVTLVRKKSTGQLYALKTVSKSHIIKSRRIDHILSERKILSRLSHPFILSIKSSFQTV
jgi:hypothetical protein